MAEDPNPELEKFRNQWREEVTARSKGTASGQHTGPERPPPSSYNSSLRGQLLAVASPPPAFSVSRGGEEENSEGLGSQGYHDLHNKDEARRLGGDTVGVYPSNYGSQEPRSALEHYEKAVEKETQGNLGDSLSHYRKAYRVTSLYLPFLQYLPLTLSLARCACRSDIQEQALSAIFIRLKTYKLQPIQHPCDGAESCPPLPRRSPSIYDFSTHSFLLFYLDRGNPTANGSLAPSAVSHWGDAIRDPYRSAFAYRCS